VNDKKLMLSLAAGAVAATLGLGWLIYSEYGAIDQARENIAQLHANIDQSRALLAGTPQLEKDVIVLRETETAIKEILPDDKDLYTLHRDLQRFCDESEVGITSIKKKDQAVSGKKGATEAFDKVTYELTLEGDAFQILSFLDRVEGHQRFLRVPTINLTATSERNLEKNGRAAHKVKLEVETFVYKPQGGPEPIKIEGYQRKRELLLGEISRRRDAIAVESFPYRGQRGRRDPWIDPRVPVEGEDPSVLPVQEQTRIVDGLVEQMVEVKGLWEGLRRPDVTIVEQMTMRSELETKLSSLEEEARNVLNAGQVRFPMAESRMQREVLEPLALLRNQLISATSSSGPTADAMRQMVQTMERHIGAAQPRLAAEAYKTIEPNLPATLHDPLRKGLADQLKRLNEEAGILLDFEDIKIEVNGVAIQEGRPPVALINGRAMSEGDLVNDELVVRRIRSGEIEFIFRGVVLIRRY
jgi:Tfp pilus assembly protein PilO